MTKKRPLLLSLGLLIVAYFAHGIPFVQAEGPIADHLKCYKIKDSAKNKKIEVRLFTPRFGLTEDCKITKKAVEFCTPATKEVLSEVDLIEIPSEPAAGDYICYQIQCKKQPVPDDQVVTDQFETRKLGKFKAFKLCTPAARELSSSACNDSTRTLFAEGGVGEGCRQFTADRDSCELAWRLSAGGEGEAVSCFFGMNKNGEEGCFGCGPPNEDDGVCENSCP